MTTTEERNEQLAKIEAVHADLTSLLNEWSGPEFASGLPDNLLELHAVKWLTHSLNEWFRLRCDYYYQQWLESVAPIRDNE